MKDVILPKFGFTQETGEIVQWLKREGDTVRQGEPIAEVTTDKTNMEVEAPADGVLAAFRYAEGDVVPVTAVICTILAAGETAPQSSGAPGTITPVAARLAKAQGIDPASISGSGHGGKVTQADVRRTIAATPAARADARRKGIALESVDGHGPRGRVQLADVRAAAESAASTHADYDVVPFTGMRRTIAMRLQQSMQQAPHVTFDADVDMSAIQALRARHARDASTGLGLTACVVKACAWALARHPRINCQLNEAQGEIRLLNAINIGIAVALDDGLLVPVIHDAPTRGLQALNTMIGDLATRAKAGKLKPAELHGGTFTVSNLGMYGIDRFTAIINPPESAILAVGRIREAGAPAGMRPEMTVRLSVDHRVIDGAVAALFMRDLRLALEQPDSMLL